MRFIGKKATLYQRIRIHVELQHYVNCLVLSLCYKITNWVSARCFSALTPKQGRLMGVAPKMAWTALAVLAAATSAFAQFSPSRDDTRDALLDISGYAVEGRILLKTDDFTRIVAPFVGRQKTVADVECARVALKQAYHDLGHCPVKVSLAQAGPRDDVMRFRAVEISESVNRDCLPMIVLDEQPGPRAATRTAGSAGAENFPYVDVRNLTDSPAHPPSGPAAAVKASLTAQPPAPVLTESREIAPLLSRLPNQAVVQPVTETEPALLKPALVIAQAEPVKPAPAKSAAEPSKPVPSASDEIVPAAAVVSPKFEIRRYLLEGNTLLAQEKIDQVLAPFAGQNKDFGDVQRALEALQAAYQAVGYGGVEIRLPEQELERGEVKFIVVEVRIGKVTVEGNEHFSKENILRSVPSLREGVTPNSREIAESIRLANENPSKQSAVLLRGAERDGEVDATIRVADIDPRRWSLSLDNTGNQNTGRARLGIAYQHANIFDRDHVLTTQFITSPTKIKEVSVYGIGYKIPLYSSGDSIDFVAGYSNVDSGTVQDLFLVSGQGLIFGARYNQALPKWRELEHKLTYGADYRAYQNQVTPKESTDPLVPDVTVHPLSLTYSGSLRLTGQDLSFYLNMTQNIPGGNDGTDDVFKKLGARFGVGTAGYRLFRGGFNYVRVVKDDWQFRTNFSAQYTDDALIAPEQFGIGGADSVRGFNERYASNDKGYRTTLEIYTPDTAKSLGFGDGRLRFLAFYDTGALHRNYTQSNEQETVHLDSGGVGLRLSYKNYFTARLDVANVFHDGSGYSEPDNRRNIKKLHFSAAWVW